MAGSLYVLAGVNGAGKSSIGGEMLRAAGTNYWNPDEVARTLMGDDPTLPLDEAQSRAWHLGRDYLEEVIEQRGDLAFETTLGATSIPRLIEHGIDEGLEVRVWYVGLDAVELHIARVASRVATGGHDIPEEKIRERFASSHLTLARLAPRLAEVRVYDNSAEADPATGHRPAPRLLLWAARGVVREHVDRGDAPAWCGPVFDALGLP